jgi:hypothetical protein
VQDADFEMSDMTEKDQGGPTKILRADTLAMVMIYQGGRTWLALDGEGGPCHFEGARAYSGGCMKSF